MEKKYEILEKCSLFRRTKDEDIENLLENLHAADRRYPKGSFVLRQGDITDSLGILTEEAFRERYASAGADAPAQREITRTAYLEAEHDGFWYSRVKAGDRVKKGQLLGELADLWGNPLERYTAEYDGIVLYYTAYLGVRVGDPLIAYGEL